MNGSAPNCSNTGSHTRVTKKCSPNLCRASAEPRHNSRMSSAVTSTTDAANKKVTSRAISSPSRSRLRNEREPGIGLALGTVVVAAIFFRSLPLLDLAQRLRLFGNHFFRQLRVRQLLRVVLPVRQHPFQEALQRVPLPRIREFLRNQQPRETGNGIRRFPRGIGDRHPEILRHGLCGGCSGRTNARQVCLYKYAGGVFYVAVRNIVRNGVNQLHVSDGVRRVLDLSG